MGVMLWIGIGSFMYNSYPKSPVSIEGCYNYTFDSFNTSLTHINTSKTLDDNRFEHFFFWLIIIPNISFPVLFLVGSVLLIFFFSRCPIMFLYVLSSVL
jgi:hypothetical protein